MNKDTTWAQRNPTRMKELRLNHRNTAKGRAGALWASSKKRAIKLGLPFTITVEWIIEKLKHGVCEVSGIPFEYVAGRHPFSPSIDRTSPAGGYTPDNVKVVCWCYNAAKNAWRHEDVLKLATALHNKYVH